MVSLKDLAIIVLVLIFAVGLTVAVALLMEAA
jgi:hypothetical protein